MLKSLFNKVEKVQWSSDASIFLWISPNVSGHLFHRTSPDDCFYVAHIRSHIHCILWTNSKISLKYICKEETLTQMFFCEFCESSRNTLFTEHLRRTASVFNVISNLQVSANLRAKFFFLYNDFLNPVQPVITYLGSTMEIIEHCMKWRRWRRLTLFWWFYWWLWIDFTHCSVVFKLIVTFWTSKCRLSKARNMFLLNNKGANIGRQHFAQS